AWEGIERRRPVTRVRHGPGVGGAGRSRTDLHGFAIRCITALLPRRGKRGPHSHTTSGSTCGHEKGKPKLPFERSGAGNESRTRDLNLGKVALYQLSYSREARII